MQDNLGDRMKGYEQINDTRLINNVPVIIRIDGRAFHTFTRGFDKPFDEIFCYCMQETMKNLCENISNCKFGYTQSDEITLVLIQNTETDAQPWFDNRIEKIVSNSASLATLYFNKAFCECIEKDKSIAEKYGKKVFRATFDARCFNIPEDDVVNNIIWRQNDASKNSIYSLARANFSHKALQGLNGSQLQDKLMLEKGINWNNLETKYKRGSACVRREKEFVNTDGTTFIRNKWIIDNEIPIISKNKEYVLSELVK